MKVKVKCPGCEKFLLVTLKEEVYEDAVSMTCVSCSHVFSFRVKRKTVNASANSVEELFKDKDLMSAFETIFGGKKK